MFYLGGQHLEGAPWLTKTHRASWPRAPGRWCTLRPFAHGPPTINTMNMAATGGRQKQKRRLL